MASSPSSFLINGRRVAMPADLNSIPRARRNRALSLMKEAYPSTAYRVFRGLLTSIVGSVFVMSLSLIIWPLVIMVPAMFIYGLLDAFGMVDSGRLSRNKLHATLQDLDRDGYLVAA